MPADADLAALLGQSKKSKSRKSLAGQLAPSAPDPLADVPETGDLVVDSAAELDALQSAFRERRAAEDSRFADATDSEFWFAVCFPTRAAKEAFLRSAGLAGLGDKYLDGAKMAAVLGITTTE